MKKALRQKTKRRDMPPLPFSLKNPPMAIDRSEWCSIFLCRAARDESYLLQMTRSIFLFDTPPTRHEIYPASNPGRQRWYADWISIQSRMCATFFNASFAPKRPAKSFLNTSTSSQILPGGMMAMKYRFCLCNRIPPLISRHIFV